ncbi:MAG TPA: CRTAC1 family protein [Thermoanaerobaculia bacterium]|nr:CRTAC1 family protein [Thermoanaerobaculia bacterium]
MSSPFPVITLLLASPALSAAAAEPAEGPYFVDRAAEWGLDFVHFNGMVGEYYFPEMMGSGCALLDYDGDGDLDAYLVQGALLGPGDTMADALFPYPGPGHPRGRLYRNDPARLPNGSWEPRFVDVTEASGLDAAGYGMGVATGDYDGDGDLDLYLTNYGPNQLWENAGNGTFTDVTAEAGVDDPRWSVSATFFDYDRDGRLDLYVVNYLAFGVAENPRCFTPSSRRDYCGPSDFPPVPDRLFHNRGSAPAGPAAREETTFEDVSAASGIAAARGPGLGVVAADFDGDGWTDVFVANDGQVNFLWRNQGPGPKGGPGGVTFRDEALLAGVALNREGRAEASMGVDAGDFDADGDLDLFLTHLAGETNTLYVNDGSGLFQDRTLEHGLGAPSFPLTSFGTGWIDFDHDGWLDLLTVSGAVRVLEEQARAGDAYPLKQRRQLFRNVPPAGGGGRRFEEVGAEAGEVFALAEVGRGAAFGDVDGDGAVDALVANNNGPARLLINRVGQHRPWLGLELRGPAGGPAIGALAEVAKAGAPALLRRIRTDGSYASASDPRVLVGLGEAAEVREVRIRWPDGRRERWLGLAAGRWFTLYDDGPPAPADDETEEDRP